MGLQFPAEAFKSSVQWHDSLPPRVLASGLRRVSPTQVMCWMLRMTHS